MNFAYLNKSRYQLSAQTNMFDFLDQICPKKGVSNVKQINSIIELNIFELVQVTNFSLN